MRKIWKRLQGALPIDVLCTHFPALDGTYLMSIPLTRDTHERIRRDARAAGKSPEQHLRDAVLQALARDRSTHQARLECSLSKLLCDFALDEITAAAARRISYTHPAEGWEGPS